MKYSSLILVAILTSSTAFARAGGGGGGGGGARGGGGGGMRSSGGSGGGGFRTGGGGGGSGFKTGGGGGGKVYNGNSGSVWNNGGTRSNTTQTTTKWNIGGQATGSMQQGGYKVNSNVQTGVVTIQPRPGSMSSFLKGAAIGGATSTITTNVALPKGVESTRNSYSYVSLPDRSRAVVSRPASAPVVYSYTRNYGYLEPSYHSLVFNPIYYYHPFNVWNRPGSSTTIVHNHYDDDGDLIGTRSEVVPNEGKEFSDTKYQEGEIGAADVNELPEWMQASLRLMHTKSQSYFPADRVIKIKEGSSDEFKKLIEDLKHLEEDARVTHEKYLVEFEAASAREKVENVAKQKEDANTRYLSAQAAQLAASNKAKALQEELEEEKAAQIKERQNSWFCNGLYAWMWTCSTSKDKSIEDVGNALRAAESANSAAYREYSDSDWQNRRLERELSDTRASAAKSAEATLETAKALQDKEKSLDDKIEAIRKTLGNSSGFVKYDLHNASFATELCAKPYTYVFIPGTVDKHPLFSDKVEAEVIPQAEASLIICLNSDDRLESVHLLGAGEKEMASSKISRDDKGHINQIAILNHKGKEIETLMWSDLEDGKMRFAMAFETQDNHTSSIYTDIEAKR